jgi:hypothetical protein
MMALARTSTAAGNAISVADLDIEMEGWMKIPK